MVRVARLERAASTSQMWRPTNWATPGYSVSAIIPRQGGKSKIFSVCGHSCGQSRFYAVFCNRGKIQQTQASQGFVPFRLALSRIPPRHSQSRRATGCATPGCSVIVPWFREKIQRKFHRDGRGRICWSRADCRL